MLGLGKKVGEKKEEVVDFSKAGQEETKETPTAEGVKTPQIKPPEILEVPLRVEIVLQTNEEALYAEVMNFMYDILSRYKTVVLEKFAVNKEHGTQ